MPLYFAIRVELLQLKENSDQQTPLCIPLPVEPRDTASFYITLPRTHIRHGGNVTQLQSSVIISPSPSSPAIVFSCALYLFDPGLLSLAAVCNSCIIRITSLHNQHGYNPILLTIQCTSSWNWPRGKVLPRFSVATLTIEYRQNVAGLKKVYES
jgi:hypothetical protein